MQFRASDAQHKEIQTKANLYTDGNLSEWMLHASLNYMPNKEELEKNPERGF